MESHGEGSSDFSVQWTDGWSTDSTDDDEGSAARSLETEEVQSAAGDREDGSVAGDEGSMPVPTGIHVAADTEYGDEELGSAVLTAAALESAEYNSVEEAYKAYVAFAKATGFAVRKGDSVKNEEGNIVQKFFYCNRQGLREMKHYERVDRKRAHKAETRTNCYAKYVVYLDMSSRKWRTKTFIVDHNHDLAPPDFTNVMAPHRKLTDGDKAHIHSMHEAGFQTTQIMGFFAHLCGGYRNVNFIRKDLYNYMDDVRQSRIVEGDAAAAISYLKDYWAEVVRSFGLEDNDWIASTYEKKEQWAHAYLCDKFCAGLQTTSRCEGINSSLKKFIKSGNFLLELVENLDRVVKDYCNNEFIADYKSLYTDPVLTTGLESLERSASKLYTRKIFFEVKKQIESVGGMIVLHKDRFGSTEKFMLRKFRKPHRVHAVLTSSSVHASIPCGHIFCVLKELDVEELPDRLVLKRWCKDAKSDRISTIEVQSDPDRAIRVRYGALWAACSKRCASWELGVQKPTKKWSM
ncbi:hypothetical protein Ahy_A06g028945 [Arachis hypogaea]|uniref:FAR1 domain-containing protein n=1 Tax=Arachis hypogaea TaxID=3818 RepID=A0A445CS29_ARAHY|nr:hypothetical protein Ahy_A06g028945 [Arachis hypogaea]